TCWLRTNSGGWKSGWSSACNPPIMQRCGALAAVTLGQASPAWAQTSSKSTSDDVGILNVALGLEYQAIAAYQVGAESGLLSKPVLDVAVKFQGHHKAHAQILAATIEKLGGKAVMAKKPADYAFPVAQLKTQADVLKFAAGLEKGAASAYLSVLPSFHNKDLVTAAASILGDETMHWAILLNALGEDPVPAAFIG
ncbi:MAG: ferritin-like domain-containing protein, partial [Burkholderiaceae bacterium]